MVELYELLHAASNVRKNIFQTEKFDEITLFLSIVYSFVKFKVSSTFMVYWL